MKDKLSKYNVEVEHSNGMLLYNGLTDKLLPITFKDYSIIETLMENLEQFELLYPQLYSLFKQSGFIISSDFNELSYIKLQNKRKIFTNKDYRITVNPTLDCNLKCWYCSVDYAGANHGCERMSDETVESLIKHVQQLAIKEKANSIVLDWFGGEPMMYFDEVMVKVGEAAKKTATEKGVSFLQQITTNATLLNESRIRTMKELNFVFFQIPLDGNETRHNRIKYYKDKSGSYKDVVNNINMLTQIIPNVSITLRINYDRQTLKNIKEIIKDLSENSRKCITVDFQRIWQVSINEELRKLLEIAKEEFRLAGFKSNFWAYRPMNFSRCYADSYNYYAVNYNGNIFKCTARDYSDAMCIGTLQPAGNIKWNDEIMSKLYEKATFENEMCEPCSMLPLCMGPCIQKNYEARKNNKVLDCMYENVEYSLSSHVIDLAKNRGLIKDSLVKR